MFHHYSQGNHTTQGHKGIPEGHFEEEQGRKGFFGPVSHLIKPKPSTRWVNIEGPLKPHLFDLVEMKKNHGLWQRLLFNNDLSIYNLWLQKAEINQLRAMRNIDGDSLYFCHKGAGEVFTEFGLLKFKTGSYINVPKGATHVVVPSEESHFLIIESKSSYFREPERGMVGKNAFYDLEALGKPDLEALHARMKQLDVNILHIDVKRLNEKTTFTYGENVFDTIGWKGDFFPFTLHIDNLMPMMSHRVHLPPSTHTTFVANGFVVCTFLPRPLETDSDALKVPFYHQNIDYDEVLFYHDGNFFSRDNLHAGMMTVHPAGFPHGPHPKAVQGVKTKTHTDEVAVMIDSWQPLQIDPSLAKVELPDYWKSWMK
jgi:homogentisate 1,2-dioxygenase